MVLPSLIHAVSTWPISVDFLLLQLHTVGLSVEEAVETVLQLRYAADCPRGCKGKEHCSHFDHTAAGGFSEIKVESERTIEEETLEQATCVTLSASQDFTGMEDKQSTEENNEKVREKIVYKDGGNTVDDGVRHAMRNRHSQINALAEDRAAFRRALQEVAYGTGAAADITGLWNRLLFEEITEQFSFFDMLREHYLSAPYGFLSCHAIPMTLEDRRRVVEVFYNVNDDVLTLFLGDRMHKIELEDNSESRFFQKKARSLRSRKLQQLILSGISEGSIKRQWENLKRVSTFMVSAYRGREGMIIPSDVPLRSAIQRCFLLDNTLTPRYTTFVFCYEHRLSGRFMERLSYTECASLCHVLSSVWCDSTQLMLRKEFCAACVRIGRLLDENRVVSEMHQMVFGEAMRPRWQVQLDEVQRAIAPNTMGGTGAALTTPAAHSPLGNASPSWLPRHANTARLDAKTPMGNLSTNEFQRQPSLTCCGVSSPATATATAGLHGVHSAAITSSPVTQQLPNGSPIALPISSNTNAYHNYNASGINPPSAAAGHHLPLSANRAFSRRFLLEFPFLIKCLVRVGYLLGNGEQLQEALELFYTRVYITLENVGQRSSHVAATTTLEATTSRNGIDNPGAFCNPSELGREDHMLRQMRGGTEDNSLNASSRERATGLGDRSYTTSIVSSAPVANYGLAGTTPRQQVSSPVRQRLSQQQQLPQQQPALPRQVGGSGVSSTGANSGSLVVNDRPYLRELCALLNLMPDIFINLSTLSEYDHAACDSVFCDFIVVLKFMVQMCMASDDHEYT